MHEAFNQLQQKAHSSVKLLVVVAVVELEPGVFVFPETDLAERPAHVQLMTLELVAHPVCQDTQQVDDLAHRGVDFVPTHVYALGAAQPETTDRRDLVHRADLEHLIDERGLIQTQKLFFDRFNFGLHLIVGVLLTLEVQFELVVLAPVLRILTVDHVLVLRQASYLLIKLCFFLS